MYNTYTTGGRIIIASASHQTPNATVVAEGSHPDLDPEPLCRLAKAFELLFFRGAHSTLNSTITNNVIRIGIFLNLCMLDITWNLGGIFFLVPT